MDHINQNSFVDLSYSTTPVSYATLPFYVVYLDNSGTANNDYANIFQLNHVDPDIFQKQPVW